MNRAIIFIGVLCAGAFTFSCAKIENFTEIGTPRYSGSFAPTSSTNPEEIKIVSFNIEFAMKIDEAIEELRSSENLKNADFILLQEMDEVGTDAIAQALEYNYVYYPSSRNLDDQLFGLAILSKWPLSDDEKILLPHEAINERRRIAISANALVGDQTVRLYNIHTATFTLPKSQRRDQFDAPIAHLNRLEETEAITHTIIAGDFNTDKSNDIDYLVNLYGSEGFIWASEEIGPTFQILSGIKSFTLDHAFTRGFDLIDAGKNQETIASDHLPIWLRLSY